MLSDKWVSVDAVMERVNRVFPDLQMERSIVAEWCLDVIKEVGVYPSFKEVTEQLPVINNHVKMPCNVYRILHVQPSATTLSEYTSSFRDAWYVENDGRSLDVSSHSRYGTPKSVVVKYLSFQVDEHDYPMVFSEAAQAAMWYIILMAKTADFINGSIPGDRYQYIQSQYETELGLARSKTMRWASREDLDRLVRIARSIIRPTHYTRG